MGKALNGIVGLVVGVIVGAMFGGALVGGSAAGVGVATGLSAGICSTLTAADEEGLLNAEEIDRVLNRAARDTADLTGAAAPGPVVGSLDECGDVIYRLRAAAE